MYSRPWPGSEGHRERHKTKWQRRRERINSSSFWKSENSSILFRMPGALREKVGAIFDMDGVLVDSSDAHYQAWSQLGQELGRAHPREIFEQTFGMHNRQILPFWLGKDLAPDEVERLSLRKEELYRQVAARSLKPLDGAVELITALSEDGFRLAVGSSGPGANVELVLKA